MIERWGRFLVRRAGLVVAVGVAFLVAAGAFGAGVFNSLSQGGFEDPGSESKRELAVERDQFGNRNIDIVAIYSDPDRRATEASFRAEVQETLDDIPEDVVSSAVTYYDTRQAGLLSKDGHATQVLLSLQGTNQDELLTSWEQLQPALEADGLRTDVAGQFAVYADVNEISESDLQQAELVSLPILLLLSLLIFGSVVAAGMPVLVGVFTVVGAIAVIRVLAQFTEVSVFSVNVITLIGLGLAVDYADRRDRGPRRLPRRAPAVDGAHRRGSCCPGCGRSGTPPATTPGRWPWGCSAPGGSSPAPRCCSRW